MVSNLPCCVRNSQNVTFECTGSQSLASSHVLSRRMLTLLREFCHVHNLKLNRTNHWLLRTCYHFTSDCHCSSCTLVLLDVGIPHSLITIPPWVPFLYIDCCWAPMLYLAQVCTNPQAVCKIQKAYCFPGRGTLQKGNSFDFVMS